MKKFSFLAFTLLFSVISQAQNYLDSLTCLTGNNGCYVESTYTLCDSATIGNFKINIEPTPNNLWQFGKTTKFGANSIHDTSCALITDTINSYPINNFSAFNFSLPWGSHYYYNYYLSFWHKFETDSLKDGCWLEFSSDSGMNWYPIDSLQLVQTCNFYAPSSWTSLQSDTIMGGTKAWSGSSNGWIYTSLHLNVMFPIKPSRLLYNINAVRFVFKSDSNLEVKPGWIIDDINTGFVDMGSGLDDLNKHNLPVFPNPSQGVFEFSFPSDVVKGTLEVFDVHGRKIVNTVLTKHLDLSHYANGLYYYKAQFDGKLYSGILEKK